MPKVSVIVPIYNVEKYLEKCINSLLSQTLEDIQIILVNDGSKDNSGNIAKECEKNNKNRIIYVEKENGGLSDARNYGLKYATGDFIAFLDSDDYIEKNAYEEIYIVYYAINDAGSLFGQESFCHRKRPDNYSDR